MDRRSKAINNKFNGCYPHRGILLLNDENYSKKYKMLIIERKRQIMSKKVMIIDDDDIFLEELKQILIFSGYDVVVVNDLDLAVNMVSKTKPDVILVDIKMPERNGLRVAKELKNYLTYDYIPIIGMTAFYRDADIQLMNVCGIQNCIKKPFHPLDVISNIEKVI